MRADCPAGGQWCESAAGLPNGRPQPSSARGTPGAVDRVSAGACPIRCCLPHRDIPALLEAGAGRLDLMAFDLFASPSSPNLGHQASLYGNPDMKPFYLTGVNQ